MNKKTWISTLAIATILGATFAMPTTASARDGYERGHDKTHNSSGRRDHNGHRDRNHRRDHGNRHESRNRHNDRGHHGHADNRRWAPPRHDHGHRSHKRKHKHGHGHVYGRGQHHGNKRGHIYGKRKHRHEHRIPMPPLPVKRSRGHDHYGDSGVSVHIDYGFTL